MRYPRLDFHRLNKHRPMHNILTSRIEFKFVKSRILEIIAAHLIFFIFKSKGSDHVKSSSIKIHRNVIFFTCLISTLGFLSIDLLVGHFIHHNLNDFV